MSEALETNKSLDSTSELYEKLKSQNYQEKLFNEALISIKETVPYKRMKELAIQHMCDSRNGQSFSIPCKQDRQEKKKQIAEIGVLALSIDSSISDIVMQKLKEARPDIKKIIQQLLIEKDYDDISVSSVHTSDLSSFGDDSSTSSRDESYNEKDEKDISIKEANKRVTVSPKSSPPTVPKPRKVSKRNSEKLAKESPEVKSDSSATETPNKRARKPNPKYLGDATHEIQ